MQVPVQRGILYLGQQAKKNGELIAGAPLLYDARDLTTHAVCVGMTGSGKTGLCIGLLEEAAIDGIPSIVVDPKGDLSNLLLTFPDLRGEDFLPWINEEDARKQGLSPEEFAARQASLWERGLGEWGQDAGRIKRFRDAVDFCIYTPGSNAGIPVSILKSFASPEGAIIDDRDLLSEQINTTVTSLLNLLGIDSDPIQSREHILMSTLLATAWRQGNDLDLTGFIHAIQSPPVNKIGVFDLESFFPSKERFALAMKVNNLMAAPGFSAWLEGEPLDVDRMYYTAEGKPRISIFSIAHLSEGERMFFVSLLLTQVLGWMRTQSGTNSLRSLFYMDEILGYLPPVANPPSKVPLLTLLKQARAFGLGIVLATQNPVDLDYKALSNTGTWFIGRLQTERDKERVLDGLEGAGSSQGGRFDRQKMDRILAGLGKRIFLMNNVNEDEPVAFQTRWVLSYLRGPLTRNQIRALVAGKKTEESALSRPPAEIPSQPEAAKPTASAPRASKPVLPPEIPQYFIPVRGEPREDSSLSYEPMLLAMAKLYLADGKVGIATVQALSLLAEFSDHPSRVDWDGASELGLREEDLQKFPDEEALFGELPREAGSTKYYPRLSRSFQDWLYRNKKLELMKSPSLGIVSDPEESERDFRIRLQQSAREQRDAAIEKLRRQYTSKIERLEDRIRRAEHAVEREREQAKHQKLQTAISFGATLITALTGRKKMSRSTLGRASTTAGRAGRAMKEAKDIERAEENLQVLQNQRTEIQARLEEEAEQIKRSIDPLTEELESFAIQPKKRDIAVSLAGLSWAPYWIDAKGGITPAW